MRLPYVVLSLMLALSAGCDASGNRKTPVANKDPRSGTDVVPVDAYYDARASIDATGQKVVFVSARSGKLQVFKFNATDSDAKPARLLQGSADIGVERFAAISTGGSWVMIQGVKGAQVDLYYTNFAGDRAPTAVTTDNGYEFDFRFANDSVFAFVKSDVGTRYGKIMVGSIAADGTLTAPVALTPPTGLVEYNPTWSVNGGTLTLYSIALNETTFKSSIIARSFTSVETAAAAATQTVVADITGSYTSLMPMALGTSAGVYYGAAPAAKKDIVPVGGTVESTKKLRVMNEPYLVASPGSAAQALGALDFNVRGFTASAAGTIAGWVGADFFSCDNDGKFGFSMHMFSSADSKVVRNIPLTGTEPDSWELTTEPCHVTRNDGSEGKLDYLIESMGIAANSTPADYTLVYVSTFTNDHEVMHLNVANGVATFKRVSQNKKPQ